MKANFAWVQRPSKHFGDVNVTEVEIQHNNRKRWQQFPSNFPLETFKRI